MFGLITVAQQRAHPVPVRTICWTVERVDCSPTKVHGCQVGPWQFLNILIQAGPVLNVGAQPARKDTSYLQQSHPSINFL